MVKKRLDYLRGEMNTTFEFSEINRKIGPLFMVGMPGPELDSFTKELIEEWRLGGIILFKRNIVNPAQLKALCSEVQKCSIEYHGIPLFISIDQEGGRVARLNEPSSVFKGNESIGISEEPEKEAERFATVTAKELKDAGINMNLAPVLDVMRDEVNESLAGRMFSKDPQLVSRLGEIVIREFQRNGIISVSKHFPGLGAVDKDPHKALPEINLSLEELYKKDIYPYESAIRAGVSGIMSSHAIYPAIDRDNPATTSSKIIQDILRKRLKFKGVVITDDLEMGAIRERFGSIRQSSYQALIAGADILLISENQDEFLLSMEFIREMVLKGKICMDRIYESNERITRLKKRFMEDLFTH